MAVPCQLLYFKCNGSKRDWNSVNTTSALSVEESSKKTQKIIPSNMKVSNYGETLSTPWETIAERLKRVFSSGNTVEHFIQILDKQIIVQFNYK